MLPDRLCSGRELVCNVSTSTRGIAMRLTDCRETTPVRLGTKLRLGPSATPSARVLQTELSTHARWTTGGLFGTRHSLAATACARPRTTPTQPDTFGPMIWTATAPR